MRGLRRYADPLHSGSPAERFRQQRMAIFESLIRPLPRPITILDVGGTVTVWKAAGLMETELRVVLMNRRPQKVSHSNFSSVVGDARCMPFPTKSFDVVFSNSVIEHVGSIEQQRQMAREVRRVGKRYFVQTPNYWFPFEPHFLFPCFQFFPEKWQVYMVSRFDMGQYSKTLDDEAARTLVRSVRLLTPSELVSLFPDARLCREWFLGSTKSLVVYGGWTDL